MQNFGQGDDEDNMGDPMPMFPGFGRPRFSGDFRNNRYYEAYGSYSGGYGQGPPRPLLGFQPYGGMPPFQAGRGRGPRGPPPSMMQHDEEAAKYLLHCGVPKEIVRNLPSDLLQLITPEYCGLCDLNFDGFYPSRLHYVSKKHLKAQRRWLSPNSGVGIRKETPLKSRELYCELCDVQITSLVHAESHYSGKLHRSIVDGRRGPKNPILLQRPMEQRLKRLIRREKKHLTAVKKNEPSAEPPKEKEEPAIQNELYCKICKTSMSCAEQMTMHLNGKKHLTKEKQHILKFMNQEPVKNTETEQGESIEVAVEEEEEEGTEVTEPTPIEEKPNEEDQISSDWVDGTGNWEEN